MKWPSVWADVTPPPDCELTVTEQHDETVAVALTVPHAGKRFTVVITFTPDQYAVMDHDARVVVVSELFDMAQQEATSEEDDTP